MPRTWLINRVLIYCAFAVFATRFKNARGLLLSMRRSGSDSASSPKKYTKSNLPSKDCVVCGRPFEWRKKWERCWDEVKYCSERCRRSRNSGEKDSGGEGSTAQSSKGPSKVNFSFAEEAFRTAVPLPPISLQQRAMGGYRRALAGGIGFSAGLLAASLKRSESASIALAAPGPVVRPTKEELESIFDGEWDPEDDVTRRDLFRRLDESPDSQFYDSPRFVEHIDAAAVAALTAYHKGCLRALSQSLYGENRALDVLDLCSSWTSHLPVEDYPKSESERAVDITQGAGSVGQNGGAKIVGLGMNRAELEANTQLTSYIAQDLNQNAKLPLPDASFDAVLLQLSIDYLTKPMEVLAEAARVLRPRGAIFISFSNRIFLQKAVAGWTGKSDLEHIETVGNYLHYSTAKNSKSYWEEPFKAIDISPSTKGDPLYVVTARKK